MKYLKHILIWSLFTIFAATLLGQSFRESKRIREPGTPFYYAEVSRFPTAKPDSSNLEIFIKIPYDDLQFVKLDSVYRAKYEVSLVVFDKDGTQADGKIERHTIEVPNFEETNAKDVYDYSKYEFTLHNSLYKISIGLMDMDTRKTTFWKNKVNLEDYDKPSIIISDLVIADSLLDSTKGNYTYQPNVNNRLEEKKNFNVFFITKGKKGPAEITTSILNTDGKILRQNTRKVTFDKPITQHMLPMNSTGLNYSRYLYRVTVTQGRKKANQQIEFRVSWVGLSGYIANLDKAIDEMIYIVPSKKLNQMKDAKPEEKKKLFMEYWKSRDPSPETQQNELMNEYYRRINYANENFGSSLKEGWRTDMGMIYVLFGSPNDIERHPFDIGSKPYQIWYYFEINRQFVFVDDTGFGDYRLITPVYEYYNSTF